MFSITKDWSSPSSNHRPDPLPRFIPGPLNLQNKHWATLLKVLLLTDLCFITSAVSVLGAFKGIVHFEIKIWYLSAYPKGIQDVGVFFSSVDPILIFLGQTVLVCQSYNGRYRSLSL